MKEFWLPVVGFEGRYEVSSLGRVRNRKRGSVLSPRNNSDGYARAALYRDGRYHHKLVHRLVAEAFLPNPDNLPLVLHQDDNPTNNSLENLRWGTPLDNMRDSRQRGRNWWWNKTECVHGHPYTPENTYLSKDGRRSCQTCRRKCAAVSNEKRRRNNG